jgi:transcription initiation protein SPT3
MAALALPIKRQSTLNSPLTLPPQPIASSSKPPITRRLSSSPEPDDDDEDNDDEGGGGTGGKKRKIAAVQGPGGKKGPSAMIATEYRYSTEIAQMVSGTLPPELKLTDEIQMFVFGEVQDPLPETVRLVEDVVRGQVIEIVRSLDFGHSSQKLIHQVTRARLLSHIRNSRFLSAEDLIFLIRDDRGKVNRLRTYLSWKDVRKRAKDDNGADAGDVVEDLGEVANG